MFGKSNGLVTELKAAAPALEHRAVERLLPLGRPARQVRESQVFDPVSAVDREPPFLTLGKLAKQRHGAIVA
jgi:hypothetical protein